MRAARAAAWMACAAAAIAAPRLAGEVTERGFRGCLAERSGTVVDAENAARLFVPGSVLKLVVAAAALHHLGPGYRVVTRVEAGGRLAGGVLRGDLVVRAAADPTWNRRFFPGRPRAPLERLAAALVARGVRRVAGDLVVDASRFPGRPEPASRALDEVAYAFGAPTSALAVDENAAVVQVAAGRRVGEPARVVGEDTLRFVNLSRTVPASRHGRGTLELLPVWGSETVVVRGEYPVSEPPYRIELARPDPLAHAAAELAAVLRAAGVEVAGEVRIAADAPKGGDELARSESPPLGEILRPLLAESANWYAEMLLRLLAAEVAGAGRTDAGLELERRFLEEEVGVAADAFSLDDASGLSPYNLIAPEAVVALLAYAWRQPWRGTLVAALARPGHGTLAGWPALPPLAGKTGTVRNAQALAGYLDPAAADPTVFACFLVARTDERWTQRAEIAARLRRWRRPATPGG